MGTVRPAPSRRLAPATGFLVAVAILTGCLDDADTNTPAPETDDMTQENTRGETILSLDSPAFDNGSAIPAEYSCEGEDASPEIRLANAPPNATHWALIMDDPDAPRGTFTHWTLWNVPATAAVLPRNADIAGLGGKEGETSFGDVGYGGPCPPSGTHRYFFKAYALAAPLNLPEGANVDEVRAAVEGAAIGRGELMGTFTRD